MLKEAKELAAKKKMGRQLIMRKKQGLLIIMDGLGQTGSGAGGMTPLESASTPIWSVCFKWVCAEMYTPLRRRDSRGHGCGPSADIRLGDSSRVLIWGGRGPLGPAVVGLELMDGDVAFRGNFANRYRGYGGGGPQGRAKSARVRSFWHRP